MEILDSRWFLVGLIVLFPSIAIVNSLIFGAEMRRFANRIRIIGTETELEMFKALVKRQMYAALVQMLLLAAPAVLYAIGVVRGRLGAIDLVFVALPSAMVLVLGLILKKTEARIRAIPTTTEELADVRDQIVNIWSTKPFPKW